MHGISASLSRGEAIRYTAGQVDITLQRTDSGQTYTVTSYQHELRLTDWCGSYATEAEARTMARHAATVFLTYGTARVVETRRQELVAIIAEQERRQARRMHDKRLLDAARTQAARIATLADLAQIADLRARHAA